MALRTIVSASSRRVTITGGGLRPMRCMAASRAEIEPCRSSSDPRKCLSCASSSPSRDSIRLSCAFALLDQLGRFDEPSIDALALGCDLVEVGLQLLAAAFVGLEAAAVGLQPLAGLVGGESLRRRGLRHCHHERGKQPRRASGSAARARRPWPMRPLSYHRHDRCPRIGHRCQSMSEFTIMDHANCGIGELAAAADPCHCSGPTTWKPRSISDGDRGDCGAPGAGGRAMEHDAGHQPELEPDADALARRAAVSRHRCDHDAALLPAPLTWHAVPKEAASSRAG